MMKDGLIGIAFTLATASRSVPSASGFAALSKPMWLSLICRKVNPVDSAATASPIIPTEWGTPPLTAQSTPVPAQTMHSSTSRRPNPCPRSSKPFLAMSHLPVGQTAPNGAANQETRPFRALFPNNIQFLQPRVSPLQLLISMTAPDPHPGFCPVHQGSSRPARGQSIATYPGSGFGLAEQRPARITFRNAARLAHSISQRGRSKPIHGGTL